MNLLKGVSAVALAASVNAAMLVPGTALAGHETATFDYLIGTGALCDLAPTACPVISRSKDGDTIEVTGSGTIGVNPDVVTGGGTFVHKRPDGTVVGSGTWTATELVSFRSFGSGAAQGLPEEFWGGRAKIRVHLTPDGGGPGFDATMRIVCTLGDHIPGSAVEGIEISIRHAPNFKDEVSGFTLFVRTSE